MNNNSAFKKLWIGPAASPITPKASARKGEVIFFKTELSGLRHLGFPRQNLSICHAK